MRKSVTIQYLNNAANATHKYSADTTFTLKYIELADIEVGDFSDEMFADYGKLNTILTIEIICVPTIPQLKVLLIQSV